MHRRNLLDNLHLYTLHRPDEEDAARRFIAFVREHENCFTRELVVGHVTGSAWVVSGDGRRVMLTHHRKLGRWLQPGGHVDGHSDVLAEAMREAHEESGLLNLIPVSREIFDIDIHAIPETSKEKAHFHYDVRYVLQVSGAEELVKSEESNDLAWVALDKIQDYTQEESVLRMARKWREFERF